ncbi:hypothetical protein J8F10_25645 [Gemmata sp. G18]|uniref:Uncharacterized protein n=1 Tax=Gemmata palustris TaxID=2822762 RepID=A0ABS5BY25_9BACT|nr:hypothetical protein [Gemmata palustris]MBP3958645.1 hypothetical protein [Gemmata palustris]
MTRHARETISLAVAAALGEAALVAFVTTDWSAVGANAMLFAFLAGPPLFLAMTAWRRRTHPARSRLLFLVAVAVAVGGLGVLGFDLYRYSTDAQFRRTPNMHGLVVPIVQWIVILAIWLGLVIQESREKRNANRVTTNAGPSEVKTKHL